jgi:putative transposase
VTGLASSTFYYQPKSDPSERQRHDAELRDLIEAIQAEFPGYGYRRVQHELEHRGMRVNAKRIRRVMSEHGLRPILWRSFVRTTDSNHSHRIYPNLLKNQTVSGPNQVWVADITYSDTHQFRLPGRNPRSVYAQSCWMGDFQTDRR